MKGRTMRLLALACLVAAGLLTAGASATVPDRTLGWEAATWQACSNGMPEGHLPGLERQRSAHRGAGADG